jgi:nucleoside-diphosphate-sugar epimerase
LNVLVTGGGGFLGQAICAQLLAQGHHVRAFNRSPNPALARLGVEPRLGDIANLDAVLDAADGVDAIIHSAGKVGAWGSPEDYYDSNVCGTDHVLAACELHGIGKLVFTSSPSVVQSGRDIDGADESLPYPTRFASVYAQTKALAEQRVLGANGNELATVALRPHFIWGPGDPNLLPARARGACA